MRHSLNQLSNRKQGVQYIMEQEQTMKLKSVTAFLRSSREYRIQTWSTKSVKALRCYK